MDERRLDEEVAQDEVGRDESVQPRGVAGHPSRHLAAREEAHPGAHRGERRVGGEGGELDLDPARVGHVVGVHADHHLGVAAGEPPLQRPGDPLPGAVDHDDAPIPPGEPLQDLQGPVAGAVVHRHQREVATGLPQDGDRGGADGARRVARGQQDGGARQDRGYPS